MAAVQQAQEATEARLAELEHRQSKNPAPAREALAPVINAQGAAAMEEPLHAQQEWQAAAAGGAAAACRPRPVQQAAGDRALLAGLRQKLQQQAAKHAACEEALRAQLLKRNAALAEADRRFGELEGMMRRIAIHAGVPC